MAFYTGKLGGENFAGFPARTLTFVRVPPVIPTIASFDPVTDYPMGLRTRNQTYVYPASVSPTLTPPVIPAVTAWGQQEPFPVQDVKRQQFTYPEAVEPLVPIVSVLVIGWRIPRDIQVAQRPLAYAYPAFALNPAPVIAGEIITIDKWFKLGDAPFPGLKSRPDLASPFAFQFPVVTETITVDKWYTAPGGPQRDAARIQNLFSAGGFTELVTAAENITVDKWYSLTARALPGAQANQYSYPAAASFVRLPPAPEVVTMDKWYNRASTPVMNRAQTQYTYSSYFTDTKTPVVVVTGVLYEERLELGNFSGITVPDIPLGMA